MYITAICIQKDSVVCGDFNRLYNFVAILTVSYFHALHEFKLIIICNQTIMKHSSNHDCRHQQV